MSTNNSFISFMAYIAILACSQNEVAIAKEFIKETRTVCITQGCLEGKTLPGYQTHAYEAFLGIPFAEPPIGELRFAVNLIVLNIKQIYSLYTKYDSFKVTIIVITLPYYSNHKYRNMID